MISIPLVSGMYLLAQMNSMATATEHATEKVVNGTFASILDYPHQAFVAIIGVGNDSPVAIKSYGCAVLISSYWLLSVAHLMLDNERIIGGTPIYKIILGVDDFTQTGVVADLDFYRCHADHDLKYWRSPNDICLLKTREMIPFSDRVRPVDLPEKDEEKSYYKKEPVKFSGFGKTYDPEDKFEGLKLREVAMELLTFKDCTLTLDVEILLTSLCTVIWLDRSDHWQLVRGPLGGTSYGDSGSGLVAKRNLTGKWVLLGILSFGLHDREENTPLSDGYTAVSHFMDWIFENMY